MPGDIPSERAYKVFQNYFSPAASSAVNLVLVQGPPGSQVATSAASANFTLDLHAWMREDKKRSERVLSFESPWVYSMTPLVGPEAGGVPLPNLVDFYSAPDNSSFLIDIWVTAGYALP